MYINLTKLKEKYSMNITGIVHVGAHYGEEYESYKQCGIKDENIIMFEPIKNSFQQLMKRLKDTNVTLVNLALGNSITNCEMYVEEKNQGQSSSILKPVKHLIEFPDIIFNKIEEVSMMSLDRYFEHTPLDEWRKYNFINMDVQGYELEVLKGAIQTLEHVNYIYCEVNRDEVYEKCARVEEIDSFLGKYNFERKETVWASPMWGDAFYVKHS